MDYGGRLYVQPVALSGTAAAAQAPLAALIFLRRDHERFDGLRSISAASGATRLIANALNLMAHPSDGLDAAVALSKAVACFELDVTDLGAASNAIRRVMIV
jgi:hypothetical protein